MKRQILGLALGWLLIVGLAGCGLADSMIGNVMGGSKGNTVASLWPDVPSIQGAQKSTLDLPLTVQLAIQGAIKASASNSDVNLDSFDWIAYSTTQTPDQVSKFYTLDRMKTAGWVLPDQPGCTVGNSSKDANISGGFCLFGKGQATPTDKGTLLLMIMAQDDSTKQTQIFYVRLTGVINKTPTK